MATGGLGISLVSNYLKTYYLPNGLFSEITEDSKMFQDFKEMGSMEPITGEKTAFSIEYSRQSGVQIANETADLPTVNPRKHIKPEVVARQIYARTSVDVFTLASTKNNAGAFMNAFIERFDTLIEDLSNGVQLSAWTDDNAKLAYVSADGGAVSEATVTVSNVDRFEEGIQVKVYANDGAGGPTGSALATYTVVAFDIENDQVTFSGSRDWTAGDANTGDVIVFNSTALGLDVEGLESQMSTVAEKGTIHNIDRTVDANKFYVAEKIDNGATVAILDEQILRKAKSRSQRLAPKKRSQMINRRIYSGIAELDGYESTIVSDRRYPSEGTAPSYETGKSREELLFDNIIMRKDKYATAEKAYMLSCGSFNVHVLEEMSWMDLDGSMLSRIANKPGYEGSSFMFWNLSNVNLRENVRIDKVKKYDPSV